MANTWVERSWEQLAHDLLADLLALVDPTWPNIPALRFPYPYDPLRESTIRVVRGRAAAHRALAAKNVVEGVGHEARGADSAVRRSCYWRRRR